MSRKRNKNVFDSNNTIDFGDKFSLDEFDADQQQELIRQFMQADGSNQRIWHDPLTHRGGIYYITDNSQGGNPVKISISLYDNGRGVNFTGFNRQVLDDDSVSELEDAINSGKGDPVQEMRDHLKENKDVLKRQWDKWYGNSQKPKRSRAQRHFIGGKLNYLDLFI